MSTVAASGPFEVESMSSTQRLHVIGGSAPAALEAVAHASGEIIQRRGSRAQGRALEAIGHAVEYLVDSRLFEVGSHNQRSEQEAVQILMRLSRAVFVECPEVVSLRKRVKRWLVEVVARDSKAA